MSEVQLLKNGKVMLGRQYRLLTPGAPPTFLADRVTRGGSFRSQEWANLLRTRFSRTSTHLLGQTRSNSSRASSRFASYTATSPPTDAQLRYADQYFLSAKPTFLLGGAKFRTLPPSYVPEVAFLGRSNVGKSSLLNALLHRTNSQLAKVSAKPGRTREMNAFGLHGVGLVKGGRREDGSQQPDTWRGRGGLVVLDMPGYGKASRSSWGTEITKYLVGRRQLRRTFVLVDGEHGMKDTDRQLLEMLKKYGVAHQIVLSKIDKIIVPRGKATAEVVERHIGKLEHAFQDVRAEIEGNQDRGIGALEDILTCSAHVDVPVGSGMKLGIDNLRWAVLTAAGLDCDASGKVDKALYGLEEASLQASDSSAIGKGAVS